MSLGRELLRRALPVVERLLTVGEAERSEAVRRACADDPELRMAVRELLDRDATSDGFLEAPPLELLRAVAASEAPQADVGTLGPYRLLRRVGDGGMGVVYLARRIDEFEQEVAIKRIRHELATESAVEKLRAERQILANLDHPCIARLLDGGTDTDGLPYLVMEWIPGVPITEYCDRKSSTIEERLRLVLQVADAVQYAHQQLIVHRDLKPANILVTAEGQPKLLDFGIARLMAAEEGNADATVPAERRFTPNYASPEQLDGKPVSTASDVYSLGVVLYQLLCGRLPYDFNGRAQSEVLRQIRAGRVQPPSAMVGAHEPARVTGEELSAEGAPRNPAWLRWSRTRELEGTLAGDLDAICVKALRFEVDERYGSVAALAQDLRSYLDGFPVAARHAGRLYRLRKLVRRNWLAAAALALLAAFATIALAQGWRAARERDIAVAEQRRARDVTDFLIRSFAVADPGSGESPGLTVRQLVDRAAQRVHRDLAGSPETRANLEATLGQVYGELGNYETGIELLEQSLRSRRGLYGEEHPAVAQSLNALAILLHRAGKAGRAEELARRACELRRRLGVPDEELASSFNTLGLVLTARGRLDEAEDSFLDAVRLSRQASFDDGDLQISVLENLAATVSKLGREREASDLLEEALGLSRRRYGPDHPSLARSLNNFAVLLEAQWRFEEAAGIYRDVLDIARRSYGEQHIATVAASNNLAMTLRGLNRLDEAERLLRDVREALGKQLGPDHANVAIIENNLGLVLQDRGQLVAAENLQRQVLAKRRRTLGSQHPHVLTSLVNLGWVLRDRGRLGEARETLTEAVALGRGIHDADHAGVADALANLAVVLGELGERDAALELLDQALARRERALGAAHPKVAQVHLRRADLLLDLESFEESRALAEKALEILTAAGSTHHRDVLVARSVLGASLVLAGGVDEGETLLREALDGLRRRTEADSHEVERAVHRWELAHGRPLEVAGVATP